MTSSLVLLKSFGDFVIAMRALRSTTSLGHRAPNVIAGNHLRPLAAALGVTSPIQYIGDKASPDVPAAFDVGRRGKMAALLSLIELRRQMAALRNAESLIFDRIEWRARIIAGKLSVIELPNCANIYTAYSCFFQSPHDNASALTRQTIPAFKTAVIVPSSRISRKAIPPHVIGAAISVLTQHGISAKVLVLEGEESAVPERIPKKIVPRTFSALIDAVRGADIVISADSVAAHLAEYYGLPTFVLTPQFNCYWLPPHAFKDDASATFGDLSPLSSWLQNFVTGRESRSL